MATGPKSCFAALDRERVRERNRLKEEIELLVVLLVGGGVSVRG